MTAMTHSFSAFPIGQTFDKAPVALDLCRAQNFHILALGMSGSGKTHLLRRLVTFLARAGMTIHVLDVQGDFAVETFRRSGVPDDDFESRFRSFTFNYDADSCGLNPLQLSRHPESGGVYMKSLEFAKIARIFNPSLSKVQESMLQALLTEVYRRKGIVHDDPATWGEEGPTMSDLDTLITECLDRLSMGYGKATKDMRSLIRSVAKAYELEDRIDRCNARLVELEPLCNGNPPNDKAVAESMQLKDALEEMDTSLTAAWNSAVKRFGSLRHRKVMADDEASSFGTSLEDRMATWNVSSLASLSATTHGMMSSRLFSGADVRPGRGCINHYGLHSLGQRDQLAMIRILLTKVFSRAQTTCPTDQLNSGVPSEFIVLDEGKIAAAASTDDQMSAINRIATEGRKYGLGMITGVQSPDHVTDEMRTNFASKFVLSVDPGAIGDLKRQLGVPPERMRQIQPRRDALVSLNGGAYIPVHLHS